MSFGALILLIFAILFLLVATFFILGAVFDSCEPTTFQMKIAAGVLIVVALLMLWVVYWLGVGISQDAFARKISEQIHSTPLKVDVAGNGVISAIDEKSLANAIVDGLRAAPLNVQVANEPAFNSAAFAKAIAEQLSLYRQPSFTSFEIIALLCLIVLVILQVRIILRPDTNQSLWKDPTNLIGLGAIIVAIFAIIAAHFWAPPTDATQLVISFDNNGRNAEQAFFDASSEKPINFSSGDDTAPREAVCAAMETLNKHGSKVAILVGSHDKQPLRRNVELRFSSNASLARQRAQAVRNILVEKNKPVCNSPRIETVIVLSDAPLNVGAKNIGSEKLKEDRTVRIYGLAVQYRAQPDIQPGLAR